LQTLPLSNLDRGRAEWGRSLGVGALQNLRIDGWRVACRGAAAVSAEDHLHRQVASQTDIAHAQHGAHPAAADLALELVALVRMQRPRAPALQLALARTRLR
jgi:hypothetical protein